MESSRKILKNCLGGTNKIKEKSVLILKTSYQVEAHGSWVFSLLLTTVGYFLLGNIVSVFPSCLKYLTSPIRACSLDTKFQETIHRELFPLVSSGVPRWFQRMGSRTGCRAEMIPDWKSVTRITRHGPALASSVHQPWESGWVFRLTLYPRNTLSRYLHPLHEPLLYFS